MTTTTQSTKASTPPAPHVAAVDHRTEALSKEQLAIAEQAEKIAAELRDYVAKYCQPGKASK